VNTEGKHYILDLWGVSSDKLDDLEFCEETVREAIRQSNCNILHMYTHRFTPQGLSINATLSESHCAIHTWPEKGYCAIDLYGCGENSTLDKGVQVFLKNFSPTNHKSKYIDRGVLDG